MTILVSLSTATICFAHMCYPALIGRDTPVGEYELNLRLTDTPGYGGDVLQFSEDLTGVYSIHRLWTLKPSQHREQRIKSSNPRDRVITNGCINLLPEVYENLRDCCSTEHLVITP